MKTEHAAHKIMENATKRELKLLAIWRGEASRCWFEKMTPQQRKRAAKYSTQELFFFGYMMAKNFES